MEKRVILTIVICMGLLLVWQQFFPGPKPQQGRPDGGAVASRADGGAAKGAADRATPAGGAGQKADASPAGGTAAPARAAVQGPEELTTVETPWVHAVFTNRGAALRSWKFKNPQYRRGHGKDVTPVDLVTTQKESELPLRLDFDKSDFVVPADATWKLERKNETDALKELVYSYDAGDVRIEKIFQMRVKEGDAYQLRMAVAVTNRSNKERAERLGVTFSGYQDPTQTSSGGLFSPPIQPKSTACVVDGKLQSEELKKALTGATFTGKVLWAGINEHYFLAAVIPKDQTAKKDELRRCVMRGNEPGTMIAQLNLEERTIAAGQTGKREFVVYLGPKVIKRLDDMGVKLEATIDFGWHGWLAWLCRPMLFLLQLFFGWFGNWGIAIILLTFTVKLATLYWTQKSMTSMKAMSKLAPKVNELKEKYKNDRNKMNTEVMNLYKQYKVNPLGGCLPMLLQMPIYIALYTTLNNAVELYRTPFVGWIRDLSARDPYYILPGVLGATMFLQQKLSPTTLDSAQARMMMYFMPAMFTFFMLFLPAGLTLYILVNTLLSIAHQYYMNSKDPDKPAKKSENVGRSPKPARA